MKKIVLDSWALLAFLQGEEAGRKVKGILERAQRGEVKLFMCEVNLGEVVYILKRRSLIKNLSQWLVAIDALPIQYVEAGRELSLMAADLKARHPIAYADCFAVGLAMREGADLVSGDPEFKRIAEEVKIQWLIKM